MSPHGQRDAIVVSPNWPRPEQADGEDEFQTFSMSVKYRDTRTAESPGPQRPPIVIAAGQLIAALGEAAIRDGYRIRVEPARALVQHGEWPQWFDESGRFTELVAQIRLEFDVARCDAAYPISVWLCPAGDSMAANAAELTRRLRFDDALFDQAFARGAVWGSLDEQWFDLSSDWAHAERVVAWARWAVERAHPSVLWEPWLS